MNNEINYSDELEDLLKKNGEECESYSILHRMSYEKYNAMSNLINIPVIIGSSAVGFATGIQIEYKDINIILGIASVVIGCIKSIDSYFALGKRAENHRICSLAFDQINKKIMIELALPRNERTNAKDLLNIVKIDIKNLHDIAHLIDDAIIQKYNKKYGQNTLVKKPNIVNGLTEIVIVGKKTTIKDIVETPDGKLHVADPIPPTDDNGIEM
jgi:hypothetical protein